MDFFKPPCLGVLYGIFVLVLALPPVLLGQTYEEVEARYPAAIEAEVTADGTYLYREPIVLAPTDREFSQNIIGRFSRGTRLLAYRPEGQFYAVATPNRGHAGYVLLSALSVPQIEGAAGEPVIDLEYRDPQMAFYISLIAPGAGHIYAGETTTGGALLVGSAAAILGGYLISSRTREFVCPPEANIEDCGFETDFTALWIGAAAGIGMWSYGILTSQRAAQRNNERRQMELGFQIAPTFDGSRFGLAVSVPLP